MNYRQVVEMAPTKIKICGIRDGEDVAILNEYKPDFAGFVLAPSRRRVEIEELRALISLLNRDIIPVGVFVNQDPALIFEAIAAGIRIIQLHGDETPADLENLRNLLVRRNETNILIWKAIRVKREEKACLNHPEVNSNDYSGLIDGILFDKYDPKAYGGTGETFDWQLIKNHPTISGWDKGKLPLILAGGLTVSNVRSAVMTVLPYCVDVSSGVETNSRKDREKIREFIQLVR